MPVPVPLHRRRRLALLLLGLALVGPGCGDPDASTRSPVAPPDSPEFRRAQDETRALLEQRSREEARARSRAGRTLPRS